MFTTVRKDDSKDATQTCSVIHCRRAEKTTDCSIQWVHRRWSCADQLLTSGLLAARHIQSMQITVKDVLEHCPLVCIVPVDRQVRCPGYISIQGPWSWKWYAATPEPLLSNRMRIGGIGSFRWIALARCEWIVCEKSEILGAFQSVSGPKNI